MVSFLDHQYSVVVDRGRHLSRMQEFPDGSGALWSPDQDRRDASQMTQFRQRFCPNATNSDELWEWSVEHPGEFWRSIWEWSDLVGELGDSLVESVGVDASSRFRGTRFLPNAKLNVAENLLADRSTSDGPAPGQQPPAILSLAEDGTERSVSMEQLRSDVASMASAFRTAGVGVGDRVAAWMPNTPETIVAFLAASSIGAVFTSTSSDFGVEGVVDRFGQIEPKVLVAADGYQYGGRTFGLVERLQDITAQLPSLTKVIVVENLTSTVDSPELPSSFVLWNDLLVENRDAKLVFERLPADHPLYILYSSGTTGKPKCIVHRAAGVLLKHMSEQRLHSDIGAGDRVFYFTTCGWMMWNWLVSCLGVGATIVLYDGNPAYPSIGHVFELAERHQFTLLGVSAKFIDSVMKSGYRPSDHHELGSLRTICSTGSPLSHEGFEWVYTHIKADLHLASISGGTDLCGCLVLGDPTKPVFPGEIQGKALGLNVEVVDEAGESCAPGEKGELVCRNAFPSMPLSFWDDDGDALYHAAYFDRFNGVWAHGDFAAWTDNGGMVIFGRSDATLNASGVRIGTAEIYRVVEQRPEVAEAIAIAQEWDGDTRIVLFVRPIEEGSITGEVVDAVRRELREKCSPRHVPAVVAEVKDIPRTRSGKIVELAVTEVVHGRAIANAEALANPEALDYFRDRQELR